MLSDPFQSEDLVLWQFLLDIDLVAKILTFVNIWFFPPGREGEGEGGKLTSTTLQLRFMARYQVTSSDSRELMSGFEGSVASFSRALARTTCPRKSAPAAFWLVQFSHLGLVSPASCETLSLLLNV